jgi:DNA (cytosine-5)-methyltransferase 1
MKILNLYACLGGNRYKWGDEHEITAVELDPELARMYQERFPDDKVIVADAHQYLLDHYKEFDFVWSSPPCPTHGRLVKATRHDINVYPDMKLYEEIILLQHFFKGKYVVENVISYYKPLIHPYKSSRHYYWSNFVITPCDNLPKIKDMSRSTRGQMAEYLGFDYTGKNIYIKGNHDPAQVLRNCIHPLEGKHILERAMGIIRQENPNQTTLF